jgi:serine/threonine protein kinase
MALSSGTRLGAYEIVSLLGKGGMGEVYRAKDTKLGRDVALKILPDAFTNDPERLARFRREAQVLASLNHPHIGAIYGLDEANATQFLVLELVDGESLDRRIALGPIPVDEALVIAKQIAEALEAAHEKGVIHRDLKPANIALTKDGNVKVLDFGLAKAMEPTRAPLDLANSPTITSPAMMTGIGMILGTAAYMSPEQAKGKPFDKRSDVWAFGVVLLEMLTGRQVFGGETVSHVLASVLKDAPDLGALPSETPASIRKLLRRCLEKDRRNRLADAADARLEIEDALAGSLQDTASTTTLLPAPRTRIAPLVGAFVAGTVLAVAGVLLLMRIRPATRALAGISGGGRASAVTYKPLSFEPGGNTDPVWSPDGNGTAFAARQSEDEPFQVYVRYLDSSTSTQLTHTEANAQPIAWTTAGRIVFRSTVTPPGLWSISHTGGQAEPLLRVGAVGAASITASRDGSVVAYYGQQEGKYGLWISAPAGSPPTRYAPAPFEADVSVNQPTVQFSPDGKQLLLFCNATRGEEAWLMPYPADSSRPPRQILQHVLGGFSYTPRFLDAGQPARRDVVRIGIGAQSALCRGCGVGDDVGAVERHDVGAAAGRVSRRNPAGVHGANDRLQRAPGGRANG